MVILPILAIRNGTRWRHPTACVYLQISTLVPWMIMFLIPQEHTTHFSQNDHVSWSKIMFLQMVHAEIFSFAVHRLFSLLWFRHHRSSLRKEPWIEMNWNDFDKMLGAVCAAYLSLTRLFVQKLDPFWENKLCGMPPANSVCISLH